VEAVTPVEDPNLRSRLERLLELYLKDNRVAWDMQSDGSFIQRQPDEGEDVRNSQLQLIQQWSQGVLQS